MRLYALIANLVLNDLDALVSFSRRLILCSSLIVIKTNKRPFKTTGGLEESPLTPRATSQFNATAVLLYSLLFDILVRIKAPQSLATNRADEILTGKATDDTQTSVQIKTRILAAEVSQNDMGSLSTAIESTRLFESDRRSYGEKDAKCFGDRWISSCIQSHLISIQFSPP